MRERRALAGDRGLERALAPRMLVELLLAEPERLAELELADRLLDPIAQPLGKVGGEDRPLPRTDEPVEGALLRIGELHLAHAKQ